MTRHRDILAWTVAPVAAAIMATVPALAMPQAVPDVQPTATVVAGNCYAIGQQIADQNGGTLAKASEDTQGGQPVCRIVVLVKGKEGERPRRAEFVVPQG